MAQSSKGSMDNVAGLMDGRFHQTSFDGALVLPFISATLCSNISASGLIISSQKTNDSNRTRSAIDRAAGNISRRYGWGVTLGAIRENILAFDH